MRIAQTQISDHGTTFDYKVPPEAFAVLNDLVATGEVASFSPVQVSVTLYARESYIDARGHLSTAVSLSCSRCLASLLFAMEQDFNLRFSQQIPKDLSPTPEDDGTDLELTAEEVGLIYFKGDELDLHDAIQEQVVMGLPFKPLCRPDCKGLCPKCGTDLNQGTCQCGHNGGGSPFDILKNLKMV